MNRGDAEAKEVREAEEAKEVGEVEEVKDVGEVGKAEEVNDAEEKTSRGTGALTLPLSL